MERKKRNTEKQIRIADLPSLKELPKRTDKQLLGIAAKAKIGRKEVKKEIISFGQRIKDLKLLEGKFTRIQMQALIIIGERRGKDCPARKQYDSWSWRHWGCLAARDNTTREGLNNFYATYCRQCKLTKEQVKAKILFKEVFRRKRS